MADAAGAANRIKATTFNPSGVHPNTLPPGTDLSDARQYLTDNVVDGEPLNEHQDHPGATLAEVYANALGNPAAAGAAVYSAAAASAASGNTRQVGRELTALFSAPLPLAIGHRVTLIPDAADANSGNPFRLHGMEAVMDAIAAKYREVYRRYQSSECGP